MYLISYFNTYNNIFSLHAFIPLYLIHSFPGSPTHVFTFFFFSVLVYFLLSTAVSGRCGAFMGVLPLSLLLKPPLLLLYSLRNAQQRAHKQHRGERER